MIPHTLSRIAAPLFVSRSFDEKTMATLVISNRALVIDWGDVIWAVVEKIARNATH